MTFPGSPQLTGAEAALDALCGLAESFDLPYTRSNKDQQIHLVARARGERYLLLASVQEQGALIDFRAGLIPQSRLEGRDWVIRELLELNSTLKLGSLGIEADTGDLALRVPVLTGLRYMTAQEFHLVLATLNWVVEELESKLLPRLPVGETLQRLLPLDEDD